jgi:hypothetical protein
MTLQLYFGALDEQPHVVLAGAVKVGTSIHKLECFCGRFRTMVHFSHEHFEHVKEVKGLKDPRLLVQTISMCALFWRLS